MPAVTLEVENGVNDMFQHPRAGECPFLRDVADQEAGKAVRLRKLDKPGRTLAHLRDAARGRAQVFSIHRLDRVDHER